MSTNQTKEVSVAETSHPENPPENRGSLLQRWGYPLMIVLGIVAAGAASFVVQDWNHLWGNSTHVTGTQAGPQHVKVVYIDSGKIMGDVIQKITADGGLSHRDAAEIGLAVGSTIQDVAKVYAARGDLVLSRNVLAAPASNNLTRITESVVMKKVHHILAGQSDAQP